jgi:hypothetical protein
VSPDRRVDAFSLRALRFHVPLLIGVSVCVFAGWFELSRARQGHTIAWVYAFEWPGFAVVGIYMWWRMITNADDARTASPPTLSPEQQHAAADDPGLAAWQQYLSDAERADRARNSDAPN